MTARMTNQQQHLYLRERVKAKVQALYAEARERDPAPKEPVHIWKARQVVKKWDEGEMRKYHERRNAREKKVGIARSAVMTKILFSEPLEALRAVEQFEQMSFYVLREVGHPYLLTSKLRKGAK